MSEVYKNTRSNNPKLFEYDLPKKYMSKYVSPSNLYNIVRDDHLVDLLKLKMEYKCSSLFNTYLKDGGNKFEENIIELIKARYPVKFVSRTLDIKSIHYARNIIKKKEIPILYSVPFKNEKDRTHGIIDVLIRNDYIRILFPDLELDVQDLPKHYIVVDIKWKTLDLYTDGKHLRNSSDYRYYKTQCFIYTQAIKHIQNFESNYALILGKATQYRSHGTKIKNIGSIGSPAIIDFKTDITYQEKVPEYLETWRKFKRVGYTIPVNNPEVSGIYPNLNVKGDMYNFKKKIAEEIKDITSVWNCSTTHRNIAFENNIRKWTDSKLNSHILGIKGHRGIIIDSMLDINRQSIDIIRPRRINTDMYQWRNTNDTADIYVDFETMPSIFTNTGNDFLFLIGIYYNSNYIDFTCQDITENEEKRIILEFMDFLTNIGNHTLWYWYAEQSIWDRKIKQYNLSIYELYWADLRKIFYSEPVVIKDCFSFGLKDIVYSLNKYQLINCPLDSECKNGKDAMIYAYRYYQKKDEQIISDIKKYNKFDVEVLFNILNYIRKNM
jgi:hypothetical protein